MKLDRGTVVLIRLDPTFGHEQRGVRPVAVVSDSALAQGQRFPMMCIVPITGTPCQGELYPRLAPGRSGLRKPSFALIDQLRSIDKRRVRRVLGRISSSELTAIDKGLRLSPASSGTWSCVTVSR